MIDTLFLYLLFILVIIGAIFGIKNLLLGLGIIFTARLLYTMFGFDTIYVKTNNRNREYIDMMQDKKESIERDDLETQSDDKEQLNTNDEKEQLDTDDSQPKAIERDIQIDNLHKKDRSFDIELYNGVDMRNIHAAMGTSADNQLCNRMKYSQLQSKMSADARNRHNVHKWKPFFEEELQTHENRIWWERDELDKEF